MAVRHGQLRRSLGAMTFGVVREMDARAQQLAKTALMERDDQFQVRISGDTDPGYPTWGNVEIGFRTGFLGASGMRDSVFVVPTFTYGAVIDSVTPDSPVPPMISACVFEWIRDEAEIVMGAKVAVGAFAQEGFPFHGRLHMNFQGYGAPNEIEGEDDDG